MRTVRDTLDRALGRLTMYRLVIVVLALIIAVYTVFTLTGVIDGLSTTDNLIALAVLLVASYVSNRVVALVWRVKPHADSAIITALLLFFLFVPLEISAANVGWLAGTAALANLSKYVIAWRGRHLLNPAAAGAFAVVVVQSVVGREASINPIWQTAATQALLPFVAVGALVVLWRTRRLEVGLLFVAWAAVLVVLGLTASGQPVGDAVRTAFTSYPIVFLAGFMLSEPLTLPPRRWQQLTVAVVTAVVLAYPVAISRLTDSPPDLGLLSPTPEIALLVGNVVAFALARRAGLRLDYRGRRQVADDVWELAFVPSRRPRFEAGQYLELHLPHAGADQRGVRRVFTISSPPDADEVTVTVRVPDRASSFKRALLELEPGTPVRATGIDGDFLLPKDAPVALVAGGIGVTPFLSQLRHGPAAQAGVPGNGRRTDTVLVYGVPSSARVAYRDELVAAGARVALVSPDVPEDELPDRWSHVRASVLSADVVASAVDDLADRHVLVSGPPAMVNAVRPGLRRRAKGVRTDYFTGY